MKIENKGGLAVDLLLALYKNAQLYILPEQYD